MTRPDLVWHHRALVAEVAAHNLAVIVRRRRGADWSARENQYRNALAEIEALA
jgi:hypothetical protein